MSIKGEPLVSILMPVYNSCTTERFSGKQLLPKALESLHTQSYKNFELIILDNQSEDDTGRVCKEFAEKDPRVRYILDDTKRYAEGAITHLASFAKGKYCFIANDDDLWKETYIEKLVQYMEANQGVDLCYPDCYFIDLDEKIVAKSAQTDSMMYGAGSTFVNKYTRYIFHRNVLPLAFGIFKTESFRRAMPYVKFDIINSNVDNLFIAKFFLLGMAVHHLPEVLFLYRRRHRSLHTALKNSSDILNEFYVWIHSLRHQLLFYKELCLLIDSTKCSELQRLDLHVLTLVSCLQFALQSGDEHLYHTVTNTADRNLYIIARKKYYGTLKQQVDFYVSCLGLRNNEQSDTQQSKEHVVHHLSAVLHFANQFLETVQRLSEIEARLNSSVLYTDIHRLLKSALLGIQNSAEQLGIQTNNVPFEPKKRIHTIFVIRTSLLHYIKSHTWMYQVSIQARSFFLRHLFSKKSTL